MTKWCLLVALLALVGCDGHTVTVEGNSGSVDIDIDGCTDTSEEPLYGGQLPGVVNTCDDHLPCTVDIQCTPCSAVPESIRYVKATCTPDVELSPFCFDAQTGALLYTGCTHFIQDPTPPGTINACFPVAYPDDPNSEVHPGVCNAIGICVENPQ